MAIDAAWLGVTGVAEAVEVEVGLAGVGVGRADVLDIGDRIAVGIGEAGAEALSGLRRGDGGADEVGTLSAPNAASRIVARQYAEPFATDRGAERGAGAVAGRDAAARAVARPASTAGASRIDLTGGSHHDPDELPVGPEVRVRIGYLTAVQIEVAPHVCGRVVTVLAARVGAELLEVEQTSRRQHHRGERRKQRPTCESMLQRRT